jgi:hypothetical protein
MDRKRPRRGSALRIAIPSCCLALAVSGCAAIQRSDAMDKERMLAAAGFQMKFADSPDRHAQIEELPKRKLARVPFDGEMRFVYADPDFCKCLYVGTESAYDRYQRIALRKEIADEAMDASMDWGPWGGWGPWW